MAIINVTKRDGTLAPLDYDKIHTVLFWATEGLKKVSVSDIELNAKLQIYNKIETRTIHKILIKSVCDLISPQFPNYQYVAARLLNYYIRKEIFGETKNLPHLSEVIQQNIDTLKYDPIVLEHYDDNEIDIINDMIKHERDFNFAHAGLQQLIDKYLLQDRKLKKLYETPQYMYIMIAMTLFSNYRKGVRLNYIRKFYNDISLFRISLPTPIMCGVRTPNRQYSSCTLIDIGDSLDSIFHSDMAVGYYTAKRAGIGINAGRIRALESSIRGGEVVHTGVIPFLKKLQYTTKCCTQNGVRGGNSTTHFPFWHLEIEEILVLKNNKGTEDNRVRHMDYSIQFCRLFYKRFLEDGHITLFSPHEVPDLYEAFGMDNDKFDELYQKYENSRSVTKRRIKARELLNKFAQERIDTGRMYLMNIDNCNTHSAFLDKIHMSNLCQEITLPTTPITHIDNSIDDEGEIALCVLSAINVGVIKKLSDLEGICSNIVRSLDFVVEHQDYPVNASLKMKKRRSLGIGITNLAYYLAKNEVRYEDPEACDIVDELMEHIQYYCIKASVELAKEFGPCEWFNRTKYSKGILPIDTYNTNVDKLITRKHSLDWKTLRKEIKEHGMRNSCLTAVMPCESSSVVSNSTNGIEPPRALLSVKKSKKGLLKQLVPDVDTKGHLYTLAWEMKNNRGYINIASVIQKHIDQGISANNYYNPTEFEDGNLPLSMVGYDLLQHYSLGGKTMYYANTFDGNSDNEEEEGCAGGACSV
jgi:ribonucleoside-diphosphate reductase alpha chain